MKKINTSKTKFGILIVLLFIMGCMPQGPEYIDDYDLVVTNYSKDINFGAKATYDMPDSVIKLFTGDYSDPDGDGEPEFVNPAIAAQITNAIETNMTARGYTRVPKGQNPDLTILISAMQTTDIYYYYDYWYWDWYYPGYWGGWYYPGYYPTVTTVKSGTILMQMMSNSDTTAEGKTAVAWTGLVNGLMDGSTGNLSYRINTTINQAFAQSPYIKH